MKYIDIYHHFIREVEFYKLIHLNYILTSNIVTDRLTKSLLILKFIHFINFINLINHWQRLYDLVIKQLRFQYLKDTHLNWVRDVSILFHWLLKLMKCYKILFFISSHCCQNNLRECIKTSCLVLLS